MKQISIADKEIFEKYCSPSILNSEYQFSTLFAWAEKYNFCYEVYHEALFVWGTQNNGMLQCYYPLGCNALKDSIDHILDVFHKKNMPLNMRPLSYQMLTSALAHIDVPVQVGSKSSYSDYLCDFDLLRDYSSSMYRKKRKEANAFYRKYTYHYKSLNSNNIKQALQGLYDILYRSGSVVDNDEWNAYQRLLNNYDKLSLRGGMIFIEGTLVAISVAEPYSDSVMIHLRRCDKTFRGIYPAMLQMMLYNEFSDRTYHYVNLQDDMGNDQIRKSKISYRPSMLLKKYYIIEECD